MRVQMKGPVKLNIFHKILLVIIILDPLILVALFSLAMDDWILKKPLLNEILGVIVIFLFCPATGLVLFIAGCIHARYTNSRTINPVTMALIAIFYGILMLSRYSYLFPFLLITALLIILTRRLWEVKPTKHNRLQESAEGSRVRIPPQG